MYCKRTRAAQQGTDKDGRKCSSAARRSSSATNSIADSGVFYQKAALDGEEKEELGEDEDDEL